jgi:hypothetical protein
MHPCRVLALALTAGLLSGCLGERASGGGRWLSQWRPFQGLGGNAVHLEVALLEVPVGDRFVNDGLWALADEQTVSLETKALLQDNGFRVGQVGATPPDGLLELLTAERSNPRPRCVQLRDGRTGPPQLLGPAREHLAFELHADGGPRAVELKQAQCCLAVTPTTADGRATLRFVPRVRHAGAGGMPWKPRPDGAGWELATGQDEETYGELAFELRLEPGEYVVVGARYDRPGTLGHAAFVRADEATPVQRLLVLRATQAAAGPAAAADGKSPPLALQVQLSSARGASR